MASLFQKKIAGQFEIQVRNSDESISRKGAKAQRNAFKINNLSTPLRAFFASLRLCAKLLFFLFQPDPLPKKR
jgi:hypothetical protein